MPTVVMMNTKVKMFAMEKSFVKYYARFEF